MLMHLSARFKFSQVCLTWGVFTLILIFARALQAKELLLIAGWDKPPYINSKQDSGFEIDLMRQVLGKLNHTISILYVPYGRTYETLKSEHADIGLTLSTKSGVPAEILSLPYVTYQNVAINLKKANFKLNSLSDLSQLSVIAFQSASKVLGTDYASIVKSNLLYIELPDQRRQVEMLLIGSVEAVVMDVNIFNYFSQIIQGENQMSVVDVHGFFPATYYSAAIKDQTLLADFNHTLQDFMLSDEYLELVSKYQLFYPTFTNAAP
jgi:polar amino acid transport system substrate-binding protein